MSSTKSKRGVGKHPSLARAAAARSRRVRLQLLLERLGEQLL